MTAILKMLLFVQKKKKRKGNVCLDLHIFRIFFHISRMYLCFLSAYYLAKVLSLLRRGMFIFIFIFMFIFILPIKQFSWSSLNIFI